MGVSVTAKTSQYEAGMARASAATGKLDKKMQRSTTTMSLMADRLKLIAGTAIAFGGITMIGRAIAGTELFNRAMQNSLAIMKNVSGAMREKMSRAAIEVARVTVFSSEEMAKAYFFLASAGLNAAQSMAALPAVAKFAQAGMFDLSRATDLLTDAQIAYGLGSKDATQNLKNLVRVSDALVGANTLAQATVEQFGEALATKAAAKLALFNVPLEEGVAALAGFAQAGVKGAQAGTALSIVIRDLTTKYSKQKELFHDFGIQLYDQETGALRLVGAIEDVHDALIGMDPEMRKAALLMLGFTDKSMAFLQVLMQVAPELRGMQTEIENLGKITEQVARDQMTPFMTGWEELAAAMSDTFRGLQKQIDRVGLILYVMGKITKSTVKEWREMMGDVPALGITVDPVTAAVAEAERQMQNLARLKDRMAEGALAPEMFETAIEAAKAAWTEVNRLEDAYDKAAIAQAAAAQAAAEAAEEQEKAAKRLADTTTKQYLTMQAAAERWFGRTRTDAEKYRQSLGEIMRAAAAGGFEKLGGAETVRRAMANATAEFEKGMELDVQVGMGPADRGFISASQTGGEAGARVLSEAAAVQNKELLELQAIKEGIQELVRESQHGGMRR